MRAKWQLVLMTVACWFVAAPVWAHGSDLADPAATDWAVRTVDATYPLAEAVQTLRIRNPDGDIRIREGVSGVVTVRAVTQGRMTLAPQAWSVRTTRHRWRLEVPRAQRLAPHLRTRVDLVVLVPLELALELNSRTGRIDVRKQRAPIQTRNDTGTTLVTSTVALDLQSGDGPIVAALVGTGFTENSRISSRTGAIDLALSKPARFELTVRACAGVTGWPSKNLTQSACPTLHEPCAGAPTLRANTRGRFSLTRIPALD